MKALIVDDEERARVSLRIFNCEFLPHLEIVAECDGIPNAVEIYITNISRFGVFRHRKCLDILD